MPRNVDAADTMIQKEQMPTKYTKLCEYCVKLCTF